MKIRGSNGRIMEVPDELICRCGRLWINMNGKLCVGCRKPIKECRCVPVV